MDDQHNDPNRQKLIEANEARVAAYDAAMLRVAEVQADNDHLCQEEAALREEKRRLENRIAQQNTLIEDLQSREEVLRIQNELYLQVRESMLTNMKTARDAVNTAVSNMENAIAHEIADSKRQSEFANRTLARLSEVLTGEPGPDRVEAPNLVPDHPGAELLERAQ